MTKKETINAIYYNDKNLFIIINDNSIVDFLETNSYSVVDYNNIKNFKEEKKKLFIFKEHIVKNNFYYFIKINNEIYSFNDFLLKIRKKYKLNNIYISDYIFTNKLIQINKEININN